VNHAGPSGETRGRGCTVQPLRKATPASAGLGRTSLTPNDAGPATLTHEGKRAAVTQERTWVRGDRGPPEPQAAEELTVATATRLCVYCRKRRTRNLMCGNCRAAVGIRGKLHADDATGNAPPEKITELAALAAAGKPLTPDRRPMDAPRKLIVDCCTRHDRGFGR
jgi:hypothetical protein